MITEKMKHGMRQYANMENPTIFEKKQLVKHFLMLEGKSTCDPQGAYHAVTELLEKHPGEFQLLLEAAINHFGDQNLLE